MQKQFFPKSYFLVLLLAVIAPIFVAIQWTEVDVSAQSGQTSGALTVVDSTGKPKSLCPLKHTDVKAEISGFLSRVNVTQEFENPFKRRLKLSILFRSLKTRLWTI